MQPDPETLIQKPYLPEDFNIRGKAVVILSNSAGVTRSMAAMLAEQGAPVFFTASSAEALTGVLAAVAQAGGEGDGMVIDLCQPQEVERFFKQAVHWLGRIDAVVDFLPIEGSGAISDAASDAAEECQNLCTQEAILHMQGSHYGHIINIGPLRNKITSEHQKDGSRGHQRAAMLRRQARESHIHVTLIQPGMINLRSLSRYDETVSGADEIARCVLNSLSQPFGMDIVYLRGGFQTHQAG